MRSKWMRTGMIALLVAVMLTACGPQASPSPGGEGATTVPTSATVATPAATEEPSNFNATGYPIVDEQISVTFLAGTGNFTDTADQLDMMVLLEEITNIHIDWIKLETEQVDVYYAAGDYPDFFYSTGTATRLQSYGVEGGIFQDWNEYLEYMPWLSGIMEDDPYTRKIVTEINGEIYALPMKNVASTSATTRFMVRTDMLEALGMDMPATTEDFYNTLKAAADANLTQGYAPLLAHKGNFENRLEPYLFAAFGPSVDPDWSADENDQVIYNRISEQYKQFLIFMNRLYSEKLFDQEYLTLDSSTVGARNRAGQSMYEPDLQTIMPEDFPDGGMHIDQVPPLTSEFNSVMHTQMYVNYRFGGGMMSKDTEYPREIARLADCWFARDEIVPGSGITSDSFIYGIKGRDFDYTGDNGEILVQNVPEQYSDLTHAQYLTKYVKPTHVFGYFDNLAVGGTSNALARQLGYVKNNIPYQVPYFPASLLKLSGDERTVLNNYNTEIGTYASEMRGKFIAGISDIEGEWDQYVATVESMGLAEVTKAYQSAYDRWLAN